jgi:hypothetical protein
MLFRHKALTGYCYVSMLMKEWMELYSEYPMHSPYPAAPSSLGRPDGKGTQGVCDKIMIQMVW